VGGRPVLPLFFERKEEKNEQKLEIDQYKESSRMKNLFRTSST
jgi:hypothetical protein